VEQPISCLFFALSAALNFLLYGRDAQDAFAHSPTPKDATYVRIDDAFANWYQHRFGKAIDRQHVLPTHHEDLERSWLQIDHSLAKHLHQSR
jgi:hypothetical protein